MTADTRTSRLSIFALLLALLGTAPCLLLALSTFAPSPSPLGRFQDPILVAPTFIFALASLVAGIASLIRISRRKPELRGRPFAWAAVVISALLIALVLLFAAFIVFVAIPFFNGM